MQIKLQILYGLILADLDLERERVCFLVIISLDDFVWRDNQSKGAAFQ